MIPKKLYQTHKDYNLSDNLKKLIHNLITLNPEFEYTFMDNDECYEFIKTNFDKEFIRMYENLPLDIMRADVWRIAIIYINGGIYCDCDVFCIKELAPLIKNEEIVLFLEESGEISNFFFAASPKHPALKKVLDLMVEKQNITRDTHSDWMVQNFGMDLFHKVMINVNDKKQLSYQESTQWVSHLFYNSWKKTEEKYKDESNSTRSITFVTTFHQAGYELYGKIWIETFIKNVASKRNNISAIIYAHDIPKVISNHPQILVVDYDKNIPEHKDWKLNYLTQSNNSQYVKNMTIRFSHKGFVIQHALSTIKKGYLIWTDGDVVFKNADYSNFPESLLNGKALACQVEDCNHVESGILIFDTEHSDIQSFAKSYAHNYSVDEIVRKYGEPYDGHVTRRALDHSGIEYIDLNADYGKGGIQSDPNETFLHPEISCKFTHNIGITGKRSYDSWDNIKVKDKIFKVLENSNFRVLTEEEKKILKLRNKRKIKNNG